MQHCDRVVQFNRGPYRVRRHNIEESPNNRSKSTVTLGEVAPMTKSTGQDQESSKAKVEAGAGGVFHDLFENRFSSNIPGNIQSTI